jgi:SAM-dependent methyltransferase
LSDIRALEAFFSGPALDFWRAAVTPEATAREAAFCARALRLPSPGRILDVPCGDGRHALALAAGGHEVTGVDLAAENIQAAGDAAAAAGASAHFLRRDMRDLPWESAFDGAVCLGNSFGYLDHDGNTAFLAALARALRPGARVVLESATVAECVLPSLRGRSWWTAGDVTMLADNRYDPLEGRLAGEFTFLKDGRMVRRSIWHSVYAVAELRRMLGAAGLAVLDVHGDFDDVPFAVGAPRCVVVAERAGG